MKNVNTEKFQCQRCGGCCKGESTVSLSQEEIERIARYLGLSGENFLEKYAVRKDINRIEMKVFQGYCIFFDQHQKICLIHSVKPEKCKEWPFVYAFFQDRENFEIIKNSCPGLKNFSFENIFLNKILTK